MDSLTYLDEPVLAIGPGAFGGLHITADVREPFPSTADAVRLVRNRLPDFLALDWTDAHVRLQRIAKKYRYTLFIPPVATSSPLVDDGARGLDSTETAGHLGDCTDAEADAAMLATIRDRLEICWREATEPLLTDVGHAITLARRADTLSRSGLHHLYRTTESLLRRLAHPTTPTDSPVTGAWSC